MAFNAYVSCEGGCISHNDLVSDHAIVRNMRISHKEISVPYFGQAVILYSPSMDRHVLPNDIVVTYFQLSDLTPVFFVLGVFSNRGELENLVTFSDS